METAACEEEAIVRPATEKHERELWEELESLLTDAVPDDASQEDAEPGPE